MMIHLYIFTKSNIQRRWDLNDTIYYYRLYSTFIIGFTLGISFISFDYKDKNLKGG